ncbi:MAG: hypothetical protein Q8876_03660 [Bacillota bacterium]|nr:hypothetical protein [Bacillota bacterium]
MENTMKCGECGSLLILTDDPDIFICEHCGSKYVNHSEGLCLLCKDIIVTKEMAVLCEEPLEGVTPSDIRQMLSRDNTEKMLATIFARVSNKACWLGMDLDDYEEPELSEKTVESDEWWDLCFELHDRINVILKEENKTGKANHILEGIGLQDIALPFMDRNGYKDGAGWWIKK